MTEFLSGFGINLLQPNNAFDLETLRKVVSEWYAKGGRDEEAKECYALFDKKEKGYVDKSSIRHAFTSYLTFPISDLEIEEFIKFADSNHKTNFQISKTDFTNFYMHN